MARSRGRRPDPLDEPRPRDAADGDRRERKEDVPPPPRARRRRAARAPEQRTRRIAAVVLVVLAALVLVGLVVDAVRGGGEDEAPPATRAAELVPPNALLYLHVSTDRDRPGTERAVDLLERFPSLPGVRDTVIARLGEVRPGFSLRRDVEPWLGDEAALALLDTQDETAGSLLALAITDEAKARAFLRRTAGRPVPIRHRGTVIGQYGAVSTAFVDDFLLVGSDEGVRRALDQAAGRARSLAELPLYERASEQLPDGRAADAWLSVAGVRRLLAPQGGVLGALGTLLDQPGLRGTALSLTAEEDGARLRVVSERDPDARGATPFREFEPELVREVPDSAFAYLGVAGFDEAVGRLLRAGSLGGVGGADFERLLRRAGRDLERRAGVSLRRDIRPLFSGEVALWLTPAIPAPTLTVLARAGDEARARRALRRLQAPVARLFTPPNERPPTWARRNAGGEEAFVLRLPNGVQIAYAVFDGKLVLSTALSGIAAVKSERASLAESPRFETTLGDRPDRVSALVFLDFSRLLRLAEQTGLSENRAYLAVRRDLNRIEAVGAASSGEQSQSTVELFLEIS